MTIRPCKTCQSNEMDTKRHFYIIHVILSVEGPACNDGKIRKIKILK